MKTTKLSLLALSHEETWKNSLEMHSDDIFLTLQAYRNGFELVLESYNDGRDGSGTGSRTSFLSEGNSDYTFIFEALIDWKSILKQITQREGLSYANLSNITGNTPESIKSVINNKVPAWVRLFIWFFLKEYQEQNGKRLFNFDKILLG